MTLLKRFMIYVLSAVMVFAPAVSLAASPAGWTASVADTVMAGATATITALKGSGSTAMKAVVSHKPTAVAVGKELIKGGGVLALAYAASQLLDAGVYWVLDPANNRIKYKSVTAVPPSNTNAPFLYSNGYGGNNILSEDACGRNLMGLLGGTGYSVFSRIGSSVNYSITMPNGSVSTATCYKGLNPNYVAGSDAPVSEDKYLPIDTVATQVVANAESAHAESQDFIKAVAVGVANAGDLDTALDAAAVPDTAVDTPADPDAPPVDPAAPFDPSGIIEWLKKIAASLGLLSILGTISDSITSMADWFKSEPEPKPDQDNEVDIVELPPTTNEVDINFGGSCPADKVIPIQFAGQSINFTLSYGFICTAMGVMQPVVVMVAMMSYVFIVSGNRENS